METFVVRIWQPADPAEQDPARTPIHGRLDHVRSGRTCAFQGLEALADLIRDELGRQAPRAGADTVLSNDDFAGPTARRSDAAAATSGLLEGSGEPLRRPSG